ncbi:response regulator [Roseateles sp. DXS20W]|uniref:Response regulator n=1 Tax=Pelomonas lactea TaxID=3299030 RepID=A0ABW7GFI1_9BURK
MPDRAAPQVLYVEDDRIHLILMEEVFRLLPGWVLRTAETGAEALDALADGRPDVLLVDMHLPDMTGLELRRRVAADAGLSAALSGVRWVALSADDPTDVVRAAREAGFDDYWLKPIDVSRLQAGLRALLSASPDLTR